MMVLAADIVCRIIACHQAGCEVYVHSDSEQLLFFPKDSYYALGDFNLADWSDELEQLASDPESYHLFRVPTKPRFYSRLLPLIQALPLTKQEAVELEHACLPGNNRAPFLQLLNRAASAGEQNAGWINAAYWAHVQICVEAYRELGVDLRTED